MPNKELARLQSEMAGLGLYRGAIDGLDGPMTTAALVALQLSRGGCARRINRIVLHCSATREGQAVDAAKIRSWHKAQGWQDIGYHHVVLLDGAIDPGRPEAKPGSHVANFNADSIGVVYVGGVALDGKTPKDTRTVAQRATLHRLVAELRRRYPAAAVCGHRDLSPDRNGDGRVDPGEWLKACPSFDVAAWLREVGL